MDDLLFRNAAKLAEAPEVESRALDVYAPAEARKLIETAHGHRLERAIHSRRWARPAALESVLGLQWSDIDFAYTKRPGAHSCP